LHSVNAFVNATEIEIISIFKVSQTLGAGNLIFLYVLDEIARSLHPMSKGLTAAGAKSTPISKKTQLN